MAAIPEKPSPVKVASAANSALEQAQPASVLLLTAAVWWVGQAIEARLAAQLDEQRDIARSLEMIQYDLKNQRKAGYEVPNTIEDPTVRVGDARSDLRRIGL